MIVATHSNCRRLPARDRTYAAELAVPILHAIVGRTTAERKEDGGTFG